MSSLGDDRARAAASPTKNVDWRGDRVLVLLLPGLGDALTASPILAGLTQAGARVDAMTMLHPVSEYCRALGVFDNVLHVPLLNDPVKIVAFLPRLRAAKYRAVVLPFPATRWQYAAVATAIGGRLFSHDYGGAFRGISTFFGRPSLTPLRGGHRICENQRLGEAMNSPTTQPLEYLVPSDWRGNRDPNVLGIHCGTMSYKGNDARRWPLSNYIEVAKQQASLGRSVRVFVGPNEEDAAHQFAVIGKNVTVVQAPLATAAWALSECHVLLGNDSGIAHLAAGLGVKVAAIFGMTNPIRATPVGRTIVVRPTSCPPCHDEGLRSFPCELNIGYRCITNDVSVSHVMRTLDRAFEGDVPLFAPKRASAYKLYGKTYR